MCLCLYLCCTCLIVILLHSKTEAYTKYWNQFNDINNPLNWVDESYAKDCKDKLIYPEEIDAVTSILWLKTKEIVLPKYGEVVLEKTSMIEFGSTGDCIRIATHLTKDWLDPNNWSIGGYGKINSATPDTERIPCDYDSVIFPNYTQFNVKYPRIPTKLKAITINERTLNNEDFNKFLDSQDGVQMQIDQRFTQKDYVTVSGNECGDPTGCYCHENTKKFGKIYKSLICDIRPNRQLQCLDPVYPIGHCGGLCGGLVLLEITSKTSFKTIAKRIPTYTDVDAYISKVSDGKLDYYQITFADKGVYDALSITKTKEFYYKLIEDGLETYQIKSAKLLLAGTPYHVQSQLKSTFTVLFGTLFATVFVFLVIYYVYMGPGRYFVFPRSPFAFARFENKDGGGISFAERESVSDLNVVMKREFENPLFEKSFDEKSVEMGLFEKNLHEKNLHEKNLREKNLHEKNLHEKNLHEKNLHEMNLHEKNLHENRPLREKNLHENRPLHEKNLNENRPFHEKTLNDNRSLHERNLNEDKPLNEKNQFYEQEMASCSSMTEAALAMTSLLHPVYDGNKTESQEISDSDTEE